MSEYKPGASVIIPCHNSEQTIEKAVFAVLQQGALGDRACEIILVDNNCTDKTSPLVKAVTESCERISLQVVQCDRQGAGWARQQAFASANYDVTIFLDDDNELALNWIGRACDIFHRNPRVGAVGGFNKPEIYGEVPSWFSEFQGSYACGAQGTSGSITHRGYLFGAGCAFRSDLLKEIYTRQPQMRLSGSMVETMSSGADSELCARIVLMGCELFYDESLQLNHYIRSDRLNWPYVIAKREASGACDVVLAVYRDLVARRKPYDYETTLRYARRYEQRLLKMAKLEAETEGSEVFASWRFADAKCQALVRFGRGRWTHMVEELSSAFGSEGYDTVLSAEKPDPKSARWANLIGGNQVQFTSSLRLRRVGYVYDERGNMHVCLEWENSDGSAVEYVVLTTVDENGENIFWRKVPGVDAARSCGRFLMKVARGKEQAERCSIFGSSICPSVHVWTRRN